MILRFVRDDPMTLFGEAFGRREARSRGAMSSQSHRGANNMQPIRRAAFAAARRVDRVPARGSIMASAVVDAIGATGAALTTLCWVPQAVKIVRERETRAISLPGTTLCVLGVLLWLVYGLAIVDGPLIGSSIVTLAMTAIILVLKIRHG
jgi:MtN3 and saliva related transmembrane protein